MNAKPTVRIPVFAALLLSASIFPLSTAYAQNMVVTYQGRVTDNGTNFTGAGQFQFALVTSNSNTNLQATAFASPPSGGYITGYILNLHGSGYVTAPLVTVSGGGGSGATAIAHLTGNQVTSITVGSPGNGNYTSTPTVTIAPPPSSISYTTFWSNDGTSANGGEPVSAVSAGVTNGLFTVALGDPALTNMTALPAALFAAQPNLKLLVWFNDGVSGFAALNPPQNLTPAPYAAFASSAGSLPGFVIQSNTNGAPNIIEGASINFISNGVIAGTISGGGVANYQGMTFSNVVNALGGTVGGGVGNTADGQSVSTVGGGFQNDASGQAATIAGGDSNTAGGMGAAVGGGRKNNVSGDYATIPGGNGNSASGTNSFAAGSGANATNNGAFVWADSQTQNGLFSSTNNDSFNVRTAGGARFVTGGAGVIIDGQPVLTTGSTSLGLRIQPDASASGSPNIILGSPLNFVSNSVVGATIGGGGTSTLAGNGLPALNSIYGNYATVSGGVGNHAYGFASTVAGGDGNTAQGDYSFAAGLNALASHQGAFVWSDSEQGSFFSTNSDSFNVRAQGGARFVTGGKGLTVDGNLAVTGVTTFNTGLKLSGSNAAGIGMAIENTFAGGHKFDLFSAGPLDGLGAGAFAIYDETLSQYRMVINSNGYVGLGAGGTLPTENLTIANVSSYNSGLRLTGSTINGTGLVLENTAAGGHKYDFISGGVNSVEGAGAFALFDETASAVRLVVNTNGGVSIGTFSPVPTALTLGTGTNKFSTALQILPSANAAGSRVAALSLDNWLLEKDVSGNGTADFGIIDNSSGGNTRLYIGTSGNVGLGTSTPNARLHVLGSGFFGADSNGLAAAAGPGVRVFYDAASGAGQIFSYNYGTGTALNLGLQQPGGKVGIGTTSPANTLDVQGSADFTGRVVIGGTSATKAELEIDVSGGSSPANGTTGYLITSGAGSAASISAAAASIWAVGPVEAFEFFAFSDERIKHIRGQSDSSKDLQTLRDIKVTDYTYIDTVAKGDRPQKKVIAQQVEQVYPLAVSQSIDEVPDIYKRATVQDGWVQLATDLKVGERVKLIGEKEQGIYPVLEVRDGAFRTGFKPAVDKIFVYGREVKDFRTVDYDAIAMLNVSATQELARKVEAQESELTELRAGLARLRSEKQSLASTVSELKARDDAQEDRLARLEHALEKVSAHGTYASLKQ